MAQDYDIVIVGSGVAALGLLSRYSLLCQQGTSPLRICLLTKASVYDGSTFLAQGGIASVISANDSFQAHISDTLRAGDGLCDRQAVETMVTQGPVLIEELTNIGTNFDYDSNGNLHLSLEGGHSKARVVHSDGAATGSEIMRALGSNLSKIQLQIEVGAFLVDLIVEDNTCTGLTVLNSQGKLERLNSKNVVLATGGIGQLYAVTTNPAQATGDGLAIALRAGVPIADIEFVQFHPTALFSSRIPTPLLSEAIRGEGGQLRDSRGERFIDELSSRDIVSRKMAQVMADQNVKHLWLDVTKVESFASKFPSISSVLDEFGIDSYRDWIPVAPAAHHLAGGILTDLNGATWLSGLWACGEVACTGVHGANRLASNSLLEGLVFGARVIEAIYAGQNGPTRSGAIAPLYKLTQTESSLDDRQDQLETNSHIPLEFIEGTPNAHQAKTSNNYQRLNDIWEVAIAQLGNASIASNDIQSERFEKLACLMQESMSEFAGVLRSKTSLEMLSGNLEIAIDEVEKDVVQQSQSIGTRGLEFLNALTLINSFVSSCLLREETRGAHSRTDFQSPRREFEKRIVHALRKRLS